jgi:hypothetical protein
MGSGGPRLMTTRSDTLTSARIRLVKEESSRELVDSLCRFSECDRPLDSSVPLDLFLPKSHGLLVSRRRKSCLSTKPVGEQRLLHLLPSRGTAGKEEAGTKAVASEYFLSRFESSLTGGSEPSNSSEVCSVSCNRSESQKKSPQV